MKQVGGWPLEWQAVCDSSNSELLRRSERLPDRYALVVDAQTAGRGRQGRSWHSPPGANLYLSLFARLPLPARALGGLSLAVGIGVAETLRGLGAEEVGLKWPNDLLARGRKLGGILIEIAPGRDARSEVVMGLGLNLRLPAELDVGQPAIDMATLGHALAREALLERLLPALGKVIDAFCVSGFAPLRPRWEALDALLGRVVRLSAGARCEARVLGVADDGRLRLADAGGEFCCAAGEVSLRPADAG
ncbi:biotin--[acetyl-CoA-carboxylase] ligase [Pseudomarimonas salicorniae]|uniref:Biotin--[acetyl-CoA-carboxylase] ligase n=1 Tax=Pseudomarimonas salicorniae TaxID=2933270 RepID=A0ABT0GCI0_9GAMM|nr:biotin--[acetyl-CoA-carboxylase] ligase [Lysobacter sp. CAU 1642]MCK7592240.1 biotin--[acetyl-CoA-carboxylase] ligase [Lysobacter sp. CAU 1642]